MPQDPLIWLAAILVGGVVVIVALALGGVVEVGLDPLRLSFRRKKDAARESVSVLDEAELEDVEIGSVTGVARESGTAAQDGGVSDIEVARKAKIKSGKIGDISGVKITGKKDGPAP